MKVQFIFSMKDGRKAVSGESLWNDELFHKVGDVLTCDSKQWRVTAVDHIFQGCFGAPKYRQHSLMLEPINHSDFPEKDNVLVKQGA